MIKISASILSADFGNLARDVKALDEAGADMIHIDVMDGAFVPNLTMGPAVINALRPITKLPFDVHLMINSPEDSVQQYAKAGADIITVHPEASMHLDRTLSQIKNLGKRAGVALLPSTLPDVIDYVIDKIDLILVMSVNPGFGGQEFIPSQLEKIRALRNKLTCSNKQAILSVDGGINNVTAKNVISAGADALVSGNFIFGGADSSASSLKNQIMKLR